GSRLEPEGAEPRGDQLRAGLVRIAGRILGRDPDQLGGEVDEVGCVEPELAADACRELSEVAGGRHGPDATGVRSQGRTPPKIRRRWAARRLRLVIRCAALPDPKIGESSMNLARLAAVSMVVTAGWSYASDAPTLALSHAWIVVPPGALER